MFLIDFLHFIWEPEALFASRDWCFPTKATAQYHYNIFIEYLFFGSEKVYTQVTCAVNLKRASLGTSPCSTSERSKLRFGVVASRFMKKKLLS